jgi:predicted nucleic-acid-binding Zn-ribbon protein
MNASDCPKCGRSMEQGFVVDNGYKVRSVIHWARGAPQKSFWSGTKLPDVVLPIGAFRCSSCGYLEFFARKEFAAE